MSISSSAVISSASETAPSGPSAKTSLDTVETWAHKMDAPSGVKDKWQATKDAVRDKISHVTRQATDLTNQARAQVPAPLAGRVTHLTATVRQRPMGAAAMVLALLALLLLQRLLRGAK